MIDGFNPIFVLGDHHFTGKWTISANHRQPYRNQHSFAMFNQPRAFMRIDGGIACGSSQGLQRPAHGWSIKCQTRLHVGWSTRGSHDQTWSDPNIIRSSNHPTFFFVFTTCFFRYFEIFWDGQSHPKIPKPSFLPMAPQFCLIGACRLSRQYLQAMSSPGTTNWRSWKMIVLLQNCYFWWGFHVSLS